MIYTIKVCGLSRLNIMINDKMIYVVVEELIPEAQQDRNTDIATIGAVLGFAVMMVLDVALG